MDDKMLELFIMNLSTTYQQVPADIRELSEHSEIKSQLKDLDIKNKKSWDAWDAALRIEQLMVPLLQGEMLDIVFAKNLSQAKEKFGAEKAKYYEGQLDALPQSDPAAAEKGKHLLLLQLVQQLQQPQWKQCCLDAAWRRAGFTIAICTAIFLVAILLIFFNQSICIKESKWIIAALASGCLGAAFNMAVVLQKQAKTLSLNMLAAMQEWHYPFIRAAIGASAALLFLFFLQSGLLDNVTEILPKPWDQPAAVQPTVAPTSNPSGNATSANPPKDSSADATPPAAPKSESDQPASSQPAAVQPTVAPTSNPSGNAATSANPPKDSSADANPPAAPKSESDQPASSQPAVAPSADAKTTAALSSSQSADPASANQQKEEEREERKRLALLIIWCIIAGFSETLIPNLLSKAEEESSPA